MMGRRSFSLYLIHPFVLQAAITFTTQFGSLPGIVQIVVWAVAAFTIPIMAARGFERMMEWKKVKIGGAPVSEKRGEPSHGGGTALARS
jgi:peptidoglycan/LPS O-acetylase OafA/YrhL